MHSAQLLWRVPEDGEAEVEEAVRRASLAREALDLMTLEERAALLESLADRVEGAADDLVIQLADEVGKPVAIGRGEVAAAAGFLRSCARFGRLDDSGLHTQAGYSRRRPLGVVGLITPWNNPLAIPLGKIAPALVYGNTVAWKPAPQAMGIATRILKFLAEESLPAGTVSLVRGGAATGACLVAHRGLHAVTVTGSTTTGAGVLATCARRVMPVQAELGGNNASIVWADGDVADAAGRIAKGAFGFAGQRCTANRRVVVDSHCAELFISELEAAVAGLGWGDPHDADVTVGPMISIASRDRVAELVERSSATCELRAPHRTQANHDELVEQGAYIAPALVLCEDPEHEVVQQETFGPVLVVQRAKDWGHALRLCNGVEQGLVASLFSRSSDRQREFIDRAEAGVVKINAATADVAVDLPFGGWKRSGLGPAEHAEGDREFYTRLQSVYGRATEDA